ncbi:MAG: hydrogenase iron-sulfur subunit [Gemmatimonadaceae bacterium]|nr:hydrogenase iron-sulfur subunit [Gemmatimonadaceae bacterium]
MLNVNMHFLKRPLRRLLASLEAALTRMFGWEWNPMHQAGTVSVLMLLVLLATGLYLVLFYRVGAPAASVARIAADPWLGAWIRTLHRYATDVFLIAAVLHALRIFAQDRSWGPRTIAWISGLALFGAGMVLAWTGFVMVWDTFGERLAREGGRLLDVLPIFSEPLSRIFAGDGPVPNAFFFVNLFIHIALPLGLGVALWLHVSRLARPVLLPPKRLQWGIVGVLTVASVFAPAPLGPAANPLHLAIDTPTDVIVAWWLPLSERLSPGMAWSVGFVVLMVALAVPRLTQRPRTNSWAPSTVDPRLCTGCNQCPQDCPWEAITMVARDDDRPTLVARVDPSLCVSCGICAGSCAPMGVGPPGRSGRDQLNALRTVTFPSLASASEPPTIAVACAQAPVAHLDALRARGAHVHMVTCVGNLHSSVIELFVRNGAPGVIVFACPPRDCVGREGPKWLHERLFNDREAELQPRVDRRRVRMSTIAPGNLSGTVTAFEQFGRDLSALAPIEPEQNLDIDLLCEPVPLEESAS